MQGAQRHAIATVVVVAAGLAIAACGSSGKTTTTTAQSGASTTQTSTTASAGGTAGFAAQRAKLEACLKAHGVTLPNRPAGGYGGGAPGGYGGGAPGGATPGTGTTARRFRPGAGGFFGAGAANSKLAKALKACGANFGARRFGAAGRARFSASTLNAFVACVKQHGYTLPKPNTSGTGPVFPKSIESNKKFQAASKSCASLLRPSFPGGGAAGPGGAPAGGAPPASSGTGTIAST